MLQPEIEIRPYRPGDEQRILDTFNLVFRQTNGPAFVDRTMDWWSWQYPGNPVGHRIMLAVAADGTVASQYAGVPMLADTPFGPQRFVHCCDSMTHPAWRQGMPMALFARTGARFAAQCLQLGEALCYGYPVELACRIGQQYLNYEPLCVVDYLVRPGAAAPLPAVPGYQVESVARLPADLDQLWQVVRGEKVCLLRRDRRYLQWRYLMHPEAAGYEVLLARHGERLAGVLVLRREVALAPDAMAIVDCLVAEAEPQALAALLAAAVRRQHQLPRARLLAVFPRWSVEARCLLQHGFVDTPSVTWLQRRLVHSSHLPSLTPQFLATSWWYTLGDSDLA